jgi:hypothetical protein
MHHFTVKIDSATGKAISLIVIGVCFLGSGCRNGQMTWSTEVRSPDGNWLASARTVENGGFGTGATQTIVDLKRIKDSKPPETVLAFLHDASSASQPGATIHLTMKWDAPSHLDVTYDGHASLDFQVVKYGGIDISVRDLSSVEVLSPDGRWLASGRTTPWFGAGTEDPPTRMEAVRSQEFLCRPAEEKACYQSSVGSHK